MDKGAEMSDILRERIQILEKEALDMGLDYYPINYEVVPQETMLEVISYGLPTRARHWSYGQSYEYQKMQGEMGFSKVYEVVLNNDPSYAFLLDTNSDIANTMVAAHVIGHVHFFKNNHLFKMTDNKMVYHAAERAQRIEGYIEKYGLEVVERVMDIGFALDKHIDWHKGVYRKPYAHEDKYFKDIKKDEFSDVLDKDSMSKVEVVPKNKFPPQPEFDLIWFLIHYSKSLEPWQVDVLDIIRQESYYFYPQYMTKIMNEGFACITGDSMVFTETGMIPMKDVVSGDSKFVDDNEMPRGIMAKQIIGKKRCIEIETSRGYSIRGADNHRLLCDGDWSRLDEMSLGHKVDLSIGSGIWNEEYYKVNYEPRELKITLKDMCAEAGVSVTTLWRRRQGKNVRKKEIIDALLARYKSEKSDDTKVSAIGTKKRKDIVFPEIVNEDMGRFLGLLTGDGHISRKGRSFGFTSGDKNLADEFSNLTKELFGLSCKIRKDEKRYRVNFYSESVSDFLVDFFGCTTGVSARKKNISDVILRSPKSVIAAYIRGLFDADGCAHKGGVTFVTASEGMAKNIQIILSNFNILCSRRLRGDETYAITIHGLSAKRYSEEIGFGLKRKQDRLGDYISDRKWWKKEKYYDKVLKIKESYETVYDISVEESHRYAANGFINHNSFIHAELMYTTDCIDYSEHLDFCKIHEKVVQPGGNKLKINPYFLGFCILEEVRKKYNKLNEDGESEIDGFQKIYEIVRDEDDISFIRNYLTKELAEELKLFTYVGIKMSSGDEAIHVIGTELDLLKESLVKDLYNYMAPLICVTGIEDGVLQLEHRSGNIGTLDYKHLEITLEYMYEAWGGPVNIATVDSEGKPVHFTHDELGFSG
jgi:stage V sporulation protein R